MSRFALPRRTFLRGAGALIGLPLLEAMIPTRALAQSAARPPVRFAALYFPDGPPPDQWAPSGSGTGYTLSPLFSALQPYKADINLCVNISHAGDSQHPGHCSAFLSGDMPPDAVGSAALTADQVIANAIGKTTRMQTLAMTPPGTCPDFGPQTGVYGTNMSWTSKTTAAARMTDPQQIFAALVAGGGGGGTAPVVADPHKKSILDYVLGDAGRLHQRLGASDRAVLDDYMTNVRAIELKLAALAGGPSATCGGVAQPSGTYVHPADLEVKMDLLAMAFQCDATRVATFVLDFEGADRDYSPFISTYGGAYGYHAASHFDQARLALITKFMVDKLGYLLGKLKGMSEGSGTVLSNSLVMFGSSFSNSPGLHAKHNIPLVLAGSGGGALQTGRAVVYPDGTLMKPLLLTLIQKMGVQATSFGGTSSTLTL